MYFYSTNKGSGYEPKLTITYALPYPQMSNPNPSNGSTGVQLYPAVGINVTDLNNDSMNITFYSNATGSWQEFGNISSSGTSRFGYNKIGDNSVSITDTLRGSWFTCPVDGTI
ncbi:MAG: hypothetical protein DRN08_05050, partial [Thermoplasmata archaeon]